MDEYRYQLYQYYKLVRLLSKQNIGNNQGTVVHIIRNYIAPYNRTNTITTIQYHIIPGHVHGCLQY